MSSFTQFPDVEAISFYRKGGFHPVHIADVLNDRYKIVNKLGYGNYATVWLVEDLRSGRFASLKILAAQIHGAQATGDTQASDGAQACDSVQASDSAERAVLRHLIEMRASRAGAPGQEFVMEFLDDFTLVGPNGTHQCVVTEVLGPSLSTDVEDVYGTDRYPIDVAKRLAAQVARGLAYLHSCNVGHGDLHLGNVLLRIPGIDRLSLQELQDYIGAPFERPLTRIDDAPVVPSPHQPRYVVPAPYSEDLLQLCLRTPHAVICDFGEGFLWAGMPREIALNTPTVYAAPEVLLRDPITPAVDVWALAVLAHMLLSGGALLFSSYRGVRGEVLREMVLTLGRLPERWWARWDERAEYFDAEGVFVGDKSKLPQDSGRFLKIPAARMSAEEAVVLEAVVRRMVAYETVERISAAEVVRLLPGSWLDT